MKKMLTVFSVLVIASLALTACGGNSAPSTSIQADFSDFVFTPNKWTVPAGQEITLTATNSGAVEHEFVIMKFGTTVGDDFGDEDEENIYWEVEVQPGDSTTITFTAPSEPGEYQIVCGTKGHFVAGMVGTLIVVAP